MTDALVERYVESALRGDVAGALATVSTLRASGRSVTEIACDVLVPAQRRLGELWFQNAISVADEHLATAVSEQVLATLSRYDATPPEGAPTVVLACPDPERHEFGLQVAAAVLRERGDDVLYVGSSTPASHLAAFVREAEPAWVGLSVNLHANLRGAHVAIAAVRDAAPTVPIVVGGRLFSQLGDPDTRLDADLCVADARHVPPTVRRSS